jgi:hypothetical protein
MIYVLPIDGMGGANAETMTVVVERINAVENFIIAVLLLLNFVAFLWY